jgi:FMN-dependent oxidoreductase (nitrilotriacetate monooxygenase family)
LNRTKKMHIGALATGAGTHVSGWRLPEAQFGSMNFELGRHVIQTAERGKLDFMFYADAVSTGPDMPASTIVKPEPLTLLAALAMVTSHIGLVATTTTTYSEPYNIARALASIDHISGGRMGWNVVTGVASPSAGYNFGISEHPSHEKRYAMAKEHVEVAKKLWDSWEDDALVGDKESGVYVDLSKMHYADHDGTYYKVKGPLNMTRPPQGYPVIFQAGASSRGIAMAAATTEVVFTAHLSQEEALAFRRELEDATEAAGRPRDAVRVLCGICPIVASSKDAARAKLEKLGRLLDPVGAMRLVTERLGHTDLDKYPLDELMPDLPISDAGSVGYAKQMMMMAKRDNLTLRQLRDYTAASAGHLIMLGTGEEIAGEMEDWFESGACDGFALLNLYLPGPLEAFVDEVVPVLVKRGLFRANYEGTTLRDHLGLERPKHPAAA